MWLLSSTAKEIRDRATHALYWYGRGAPDSLFALTLDSLSINDLYVPERMLAASYGVVMANQLTNSKFSTQLRPYLEGLEAALMGQAATTPVRHWLLRSYVSGTVELARRYHSQSVPLGLDTEDLRFASEPPIESIDSSDERAEALDSALRMDFHNYTIGRLFEDRANYDMTHPGHRDAVAFIRGAIWSHGWSQAGLGQVDGSMPYRLSELEQARTERYGKKYSWIGFHSVAAKLDELGLLPKWDSRFSEVDIDPSFPEQPAPAPEHLSTWAGPTPPADADWIREGTVEVPDSLIRTPRTDDNDGPWLAVRGHLTSQSIAEGRRVYGILLAFLVDQSAETELARILERVDLRASFQRPDTPSDHYTFAGEIPWASHFASANADESAYSGAVGGDGSAVEVETLAHEFAWESYHSLLNRAGGAFVPSRDFSTAFDLRSLPQSFDQVEPNGQLAAKSLSAQREFGGYLLYLREDLVNKYAGDRRIVWIVWGERQLLSYSHRSPRWLTEAIRKRESMWRRVVRGVDLKQ